MSMHRRVGAALWVGAVCLSLSLSACPGFGDEEPPSAFGEVPERPTYTEHVKAILDMHCVECHGVTPRNGAPSGVRLDVYDDPLNGLGALRWAPRIVARAVEGGGNPMPPTTRPQLGDVDRQILARWVEQGAPRDAAAPVNNSAGMDAGEDAPEGEGVSFSADILPLFDRNTCLLCHGAGLQLGGLRLDSEEATRSAGVVVPCDPAGSVLVQKLRTATLPYGELMPQGGPEIPEADLELLKAWIAGDPSCAANNSAEDVGPDAPPDGGEELDVSPDTPEEEGVRVDFSGSYLLALEAPGLDAPLLMGATVEVDAAVRQVTLTLQPLRADRLASPREAVGPALPAQQVAFSDAGTFVVELGRVPIPAEANPNGDVVIDALLTLQGRVCGGELFCGRASGQIFAPVEGSLAGATFGAVVSSDFAQVTPKTSCAALCN